jgi:surface polysaccharide O-acyltransferase-like enzyme
VLGLSDFCFPRRVNPSFRSETRNSGIDLLKVFAAILIVFFHVLPTIGFPYGLGPDRFYAILVGTWGAYGVDIFFVSSAYFLSKGHFRFQSFIHVFFVTLAFLVAFNIIYLHHQIVVLELPVKKTLNDYFFYKVFQSPFWLNDYWYVTAYLIAYLVFPLVKKALAKLSPQQDKLFFWGVLCLLVLSHFRTSYSVLEDIPFTLGIYSLVYIIEKMKWTKPLSKWGWLITLVLFIQLFVFRYYFNVLGTSQRWIDATVGNMTRHSGFFVAMAIASFYFVKDLPMKPKGTEFFKYCGGATLEAYLFHEGPFSMKDFANSKILNGVFHISDLGADPRYRWFSFLYCLAFFLVGWVLGLVIEGPLRVIEEDQSPKLQAFLKKADATFNG